MLCDNDDKWRCLLSLMVADVSGISIRLLMFDLYGGVSFSEAGTTGRESDRHDKVLGWIQMQEVTFLASTPLSHWDALHRGSDSEKSGQPKV